MSQDFQTRSKMNTCFVLSKVSFPNTKLIQNDDVESKEPKLRKLVNP